MTLQKQNVSVPILGLDTLSDPKSAAAGALTFGTNMMFVRTARGGAELRKRYGGVSLTRDAQFGTATMAAGARLATFGGERLMMGSIGTSDDPGSLYAYSNQLNSWKQVGFTPALGQGGAPAVGLTAELLGASPYNFVAPDVAVNPAGTRLCAVWKDTLNGSLTYVTFIDLVTGAKTTTTFPGETVGGAAGWIRVVALTSSFMIFWGSTAGTIKSRTVSYTSGFAGGFGAPTTVAADLNATCKADVIRNGANDSALVAYHSTVPDTKIKIVDGTNTVTATAANAEIPSQAIAWVNWDFSDGNAYLAFVSAATGAKVHTVSSTPAVTATATMDATVTAAANVTGYKAVSGSRYQVFIEVRAASTFDCLIRRWPGSGVATSVYQRSCGLAGACFTVGTTSRYYLPLAYDSTLQSAYYLRDVSAASSGSNMAGVSRALYGLGGGLSLTGSLGAVAALSTTVVALIVPRLVQNPVGTKQFGISLLRFDFGAASISGARQIGENLHFHGGTTRIYDGSLSSELGFYNFPETPALAQSAGGSLTLLGSYQYAVVYAWADGRGQWHRSAPSPIASVTLTGANNRVTITIPTLRLTGKSENNAAATSAVFLELYRTVASGTTFFRTTTSTLVINSLTTDTVSYVDNDSDASISANEILYTTGKVLPRIGPPAARLMESWRNRLFLAGTENPNELWVSNEYSPGLGGVSFSDALVIAMESEGGPITALCEMDDRLLIFKRNAIYALGGNGPTLTGENQFQQPQRVTSAIGAVEQRGVVKTRDGVMFKSARGLYLLTRGGQLLYAGAGVDIYNSLTVTGACVLEDEEQVRFVTSDGRTLVYHYGLPDAQGIGRWTTLIALGAVDCIVWNRKFVFLRPNGTVVEEAAGVYADDGNAYSISVQLAWLDLTQFFGRYRLYGVHLLGDMLDTFTLTHRISYDYDAAVVETETKAVTVASLAPLQLNPARRRAQSILITISESSTTQGFTLSAIGLEVGVQPGAGKAGTAKFLT